MGFQRSRVQLTTLLLTLLDLLVGQLAFVPADAEVGERLVELPDRAGATGGDRRRRRGATRSAANESTARSSAR